MQKDVSKEKIMLDKTGNTLYNTKAVQNAAIAQPVERILGKDEVASSNLASSSKDTPKFRLRSFLFKRENWRPHPMPEGQIQSEVVRLP